MFGSYAMMTVRRVSLLCLIFTGSAWAAEPAPTSAETENPEAQAVSKDTPEQVKAPVPAPVVAEKTTSNQGRTQPLRPPANLVQMAGIWDSINVASDDAGRAAVLMYVAKKYWLSTIQAEALIKVLRDPTRRSEVAAALSPRIIKY
jgi:hypothetical protein